MNAAAVAGQCTVFTDDTVAGDEDCDGIGTVGSGDGTRGGRMADVGRECLIVRGRAVGDGAQCHPDALPEIAADEVQGDSEITPCTGEIFAEFGSGLAGMFVLAEGNRAAEVAFELAAFACDARRAGKFKQTDTARAGADVEITEGAHDALADEGVHEKKLLDKGQIL